MGVMSVMRSDGFVSENPYDEGFKSLTFNGVVKYDMIPLPQIVDDVLKLGTATMSEPVEIEFAVNMEHSGMPDFSILQIRPISSTDQFENISVTTEEMEKALIAADKVMGNGKADNIRDIVAIKREAFRRGGMVEMAEEIGRAHV